MNVVRERLCFLLRVIPGSESMSDKSPSVDDPASGEAKRRERNQIKTGIRREPRADAHFNWPIKRSAAPEAPSEASLERAILAVN